MRALYSSDQCAPGLSFALACDCGTGGAFFSTGGRRTAVFSFKVVRGVVGLEDEFESLMQVFKAPSWVVALSGAGVGFDRSSIGVRSNSVFLP